MVSRCGDIAGTCMYPRMTNVQWKSVIENCLRYSMSKPPPCGTVSPRHADTRDRFSTSLVVCPKTHRTDPQEASITTSLSVQILFFLFFSYLPFQLDKLTIFSTSGLEACTSDLKMSNFPNPLPPHNSVTSPYPFFHNGKSTFFHLCTFRRPAFFFLMYHQ